MAKAINWPQAFRDEILAEDCETMRCALRIGTLYYEGRYWVENEIVDIRANQLKLRKGVVYGDLKLCKLQDLQPDEYTMLKATLQTPQALMAHLQQTYDQPVDKNTLVTVVYYKNLPVIPEEIETLG